uniref:RCC1-like domain-containing protein n=1 Tax=Aegilops tauschii subsp. strangulata TaxID=200361 RepID=A0A453C842_AEGTS
MPYQVSARHQDHACRGWIESNNACERHGKCLCIWNRHLWGYSLNGIPATDYVNSPKVVESLKGIFVVQATIGGLFSAVLSREDRVYTFSWGHEERLGHNTDYADVEPRLLSGPLENVLVAQIAAGNCYLLMLAYQPTGMSVYSVGCGQGGKLGHGNKNSEGVPQLIAHFAGIDARPVSISAGAWHAAVLSSDGRVLPWGWGVQGCLGHGYAEECATLPMAVEISNAVHVSAGQYCTFVMTDNGDVYSFGWKGYYNLGLQDEDEDENQGVLAPKLVASLTGLNKRFVQISPTNAYDWHNRRTGVSHTVALTESGKVYAFGGGGSGQLGLKLAEGKEAMPPLQVDIDLA